MATHAAPLPGERVDLVQSLHASTKRDYRARVLEYDKAECAEVAGRFDADYWDGDRRYGYGGYRYDGRWRPLAEALAARYALTSASRVLDVGCGKGYLLYELTRVVPGLTVRGIDVSRYAIDHAKDEIRPFVSVADAAALPFDEGSFDLVVSLGTLHNLAIAALWRALEEIERVGRDAKYVMVESYRDEREKVNLLYWQLTCKSFFGVADWEWVYARAGYRGDYGFIFFT
jgi:protein-L-isoaspartate(D-aspartate) O-methyltransferase